VFTEPLPSNVTGGNTDRQQGVPISLLLFLTYIPYFKKLKNAYEIALLSVCASVRVCPSVFVSSIICKAYEALLFVCVRLSLIGNGPHVYLCACAPSPPNIFILYVILVV
jgi:hypothetical protein